uniref:G_PROTEIN_RECEP_F1_2 domain-containing protein n=2 Tax=Caenorhabditis tropicalis TaxID=1561998 RepID=A0A1I7V1H8_9PELO
MTERESLFMGAFSNEVYLGTYFLILLLQLCCAGINGLIIAFFIKLSALRKNKHLRLVAYLSVGDFLTAICEAPYIIYMILNWNPVELDFNPLYILISSIPLPMQLKISAIITIGIALSRNLAVFFPAKFRKIEQSYYSEIVLLTGISFGILDAILWFALSPPTRQLNCGTSGCFVSDQFRYYWGISNMANRTSTGILISSLFFLTAPSVCVGVVELIGYSIFKLVGPFYSASLMASGICNGIIFIGCNGDARRLMSNKPKHSMTQTVSVAGRSVVIRY